MGAQAQQNPDMYEAIFVRKHKNKHVMLSDNWGVQELVKKVYKALTDEGIFCWMDIEGGMQSVMNKAMADGVEKADIVITFVTEKYMMSRNCQKELAYRVLEGSCRWWIT